VVAETFAQEQTEELAGEAEAGPTTVARVAVKAVAEALATCAAGVPAGAVVAELVVLAADTPAAGTLVRPELAKRGVSKAGPAIHVILRAKSHAFL
jgi:hypothetical protein